MPPTSMPLRASAPLPPAVGPRPNTPTGGRAVPGGAAARLLQYAGSVLGTVLALGAAILFFQKFGRLTFTSFWPVVLMCAWYGGRGPSYLAITLALLGVATLLMPPFGMTAVQEPVDIASLATFGITAWALAELITRLRAADARAWAAEREAMYRSLQVDMQAITLDLHARELERSGLLLRETEARFRRLYLDYPVPTLIVDPVTLRIVEANEASGRTYGAGRESLLEHTLDEVVDVRPLRAPESRTLAPGRYRTRRTGGDHAELDLALESVTYDGRPVITIVLRPAS